MNSRAASDVIQRAAVLGDRARRTAIVRRGAARAAVPVAALACLTAVLTVVIRGPRLVGPSLVAAALAAGALALAHARTRRSMTDGDVAQLDRAADLGGAFRSAYWFAAPSSPAITPDATWLEFHIADAATRVQRVDWAAVYAHTGDRRAWLAAGGLVLATFVAARWPARAPHSSPPAPAGAAAAAESPSVTTPVLNMAALTDGIRQIKAGGIPSADSLAVVGRALDLAKVDAAAKDRLDRLFKDTSGGPPAGVWGGDAGDGDTGQDERARALVNPWALEWAYQDAVSRASAARPSGRDAESASSRSDSVPQNRGAAPREPSPGKGGTDGAPVLGDAHGPAAGFSSLLFGRQQADGERGQTPAPEGPPPRTAALTMALRQEVVRATSDITGVNPTGARRAADNESSPAAARPSDAAVAYDRGRGSQPPAIPDQRRTLVRDYFLRAADDTSRRPE